MVCFPRTSASTLMACYVLPRKPPGVPVTASHPVFLNSGMWTQTEAPRAAFLLKNEVFGELKGACQFSDQFIALKNESVPCDILDVPVGTKTGQPQLRAVPVVVGHSHGYLPPAGSVTSVSVHCRLLGPDSRPVSWPISRVASVWPTEVHALGSMGSMGLCEKYPRPFCRSGSGLLGVPGSPQWGSRRGNHSQ